MLGGGMPVDEVAVRVGYSSASAFGAAFRRTTGLTPGHFRGAGDPAGAHAASALSESLYPAS
jgi:AraC-like DNA-binding protein